jgi:polyhydroxyalkanoate synthase
MSRVSRLDPEAVAEALEPEAGLLADADPIGFGDSLKELGTALAGDPLGVSAAGAARDRFEPGRRCVGAAGGRGGADGRIEPDGRDRRFADPDWSRVPWWFGVEQAYLLWSRSMLELVEAAQLDGPDKIKAEFAMRVMVDALAPTTVLAGNPAALRRAAETGGLSVLAGLTNMTQDLLTNGGRPRQVDSTAFQVGENLAATPGKVVYRKHLMELLQYEPQTDTTHAVPLLLSPPWINKYYVMDLAPARSFAEWAVRHGHTVFAISYRNPDATMRDVTLDDYLLHGPHTALDVITAITGSSKVNIAALCLGGTLTAMLLAHLAHEGEDRIHSVTLLNTLVDFSEPGVLGSFTDARSVRRMTAKIADAGMLEGRDMSLTFDLLRAPTI